MKRILGLVALLILASALSAFKFIDPPRKWDEGSMPVEYFIGDAAAPGLTESETVDLLEAAYVNWEDVECSPLEASFGGLITNDPSFSRPDRTQITFNGELGSGILAAAVTHANNDVLPYNGVNFYQVTSMNIIFNAGVVWGSPEYIDSPNCFGRHSYLGVSTHEIGHGYGLGHSCDDGEPCADPILRNATMYWSGSTCDDAQDTPNPDDTAGINAIYGVAVDFDVETEEGSSTVVGPVDLTVVVSVPDEYQGGRFENYELNFGDGSDHVFLSAGDTELDGLEHTYSSEGQYTITLTVLGEDAECGGDFETEERKVGAVLACEEPVPSASFTNEGDYTVAMVNTSPLGAFGCTTDYTWILDGDEEGALATYEPTYVFEDGSTHTVELRASGPGGSASFELEITPTRPSDAGCNASLAAGSPVMPVGLLLLVAGCLVGLLRRRF
ncbi:MAG: PKD domain-containing protein [Myxococcota bacterium]|nr:PKD domain-containing protein [Myxococcota bacterium]